MLEVVFGVLKVTNRLDLLFSRVGAERLEAAEVVGTAEVVGAELVEGAELVVGTEVLVGVLLDFVPFLPPFAVTETGSLVLVVGF